jgi:hypothetical protein
MTTDDTGQQAGTTDDDSQQPREAVEQDHPDYHAGWTVQRFHGDERSVTLECPDFRRHRLTDEQAVALAESLLKYADTEGEEQ